MQPKKVKIAVNVTYDCDLEKVHENVLNFILNNSPRTRQEFYKIDYFICHENIKEYTVEQKFFNSTVYKTPPTNEARLLNSIKHDWNKLIITATEKVAKMFFRSWVNATTMHEIVYKDAYDCVISYGELIKNYAMKRHFILESNGKIYNSPNVSFLENNLFYCNSITPMWPEIDCSFFVTTQPTFNRVIIFWQFIRLLDDWMWRHDWWLAWKENPNSSHNISGFILPSWLDMQGIFVRSADGL